MKNLTPSISDFNIPQLIINALKETKDFYGNYAVFNYDSRKKDLSQSLMAVKPYYEKEYLSFYTTEKKETFIGEVYALIKSFIHLNVFEYSMDEINKHYPDDDSKVPIVYRFPNEFFCWQILLAFYHKNLKHYHENGKGLCNWLPEELLMGQRDLFIFILKDLNNMISFITPDIIHAMFEVLMLAHKNVTAQLTTSLLNRDGFVSFINSFIGKDKKIGILLADLDDFKVKNDTFGHHPFGNYCLEATSDVLVNICNNNNGFAGRYGGEEFILAFLDTDKHYLEVIAEKILNDLRAIDLRENVDKEDEHKINDKNIKLTASIGGTVLDCNYFCDDIYLSSVIEKVDSYMYDVKKRGKNDKKIDD